MKHWVDMKHKSESVRNFWIAIADKQADPELKSYHGFLAFYGTYYGYDRGIHPRDTEFRWVYSFTDPYIDTSRTNDLGYVEFEILCAPTKDDLLDILDRCDLSKRLRTKFKLIKVVEKTTKETNYNLIW